MSKNTTATTGLSRRNFVLAAAGTGAAVAAAVVLPEGYSSAAVTAAAQASGTVPEQIHLTWGADPSSEMTVSWLSLSPQVRPQVLVQAPDGRARAFSASTASYTDGLSGETVYAYHAPLRGLSPATTYTYAVSDAATPAVTFTSSFTTAASGRFPFAFTSYGDLGTPGAGATYTLADGSTVASATYSESQWNAYNAVAEVETLAPLFHLLNGDLAYADKVTITAAGGTTTAAGAQQAPDVWRDFGLNVQRSAANRPWMPCIGNHEAELDNGPQGYAAFNTRYLVPDNGTRYSGNFYSFRVGSVLFIALDANDVCYQGGGGYNVGGVATTDAKGKPISATAAQYNQFYTGTFKSNADGTLRADGPHPNAQTLWLEETLRTARADETIDWIVVQMHQSALSSSTDNGCDAGIRQAWLPLFDRYEVDLVLNGHDHDYERSYPVRGFTPGLGTSTFAGGTVTQASGPVTLPSTAGPDGEHVHAQGGDDRRRQPVRHLKGHGLHGPRRRRHQQAGQRLRRPGRQRHHVHPDPNRRQAERRRHRAGRLVGDDRPRRCLRRGLLPGRPGQARRRHHDHRHLLPRAHRDRGRRRRLQRAWRASSSPGRATTAAASASAMTDRPGPPDANGGHREADGDKAKHGSVRKVNP